MSSSLKNECEIIVFGGTGSIGSAITQALYRHGHNVCVVSRHQRVRLLENIKSSGQPFGQTIRYKCADVLLSDDLEKLSIQKTPPADIIGAVYAVGHCPPAGFEQEISRPISEVGESIADEFNRHVLGLHNVAAWCLQHLRPGGFICVIGSAITRLTDVQCPAWLHAGHYAVAKAAQHEYVRWLRRDPHIREKKILVHCLAPRAVDTPFHHGSLPEHQPPVKLPMSDVIDEVLTAIQSKFAVDKIL